MSTFNQVNEKMTKYRWVICSLLFFSTTINYMDRNVISFLKEYFCSPDGFGWTNSEFSYVTAFFTGSYALITVFSGMIIDKIGSKLGLALSLIVWSVSGIANAFVGTTVTLHVMIRSIFGIGEAGNFPASIKTVSEWFPKKERALATGIFNSGSNIGAMISALFVPWCLIHFGDSLGWKMAFILTGGIGFVWLIFWGILYNSPRKMKEKGKINEAEYALIHMDDAELTPEQVAAEKEGKQEKVSWFKLFRYSQTWSFFFGKFMTDGIWWFLLFWLPDYLKKQFNMTTQEVMWPTFIVFGIAIIGSVFGGSIPMFFMKKGLNVYKARMTAMLIIALFPVLLLLTQYFGNKEIFGSYAMYLATAVICLAGAAHQAWSANIFTTVSDMFPKKAVASVTGIGGLAGGIGGVLVQLLAGFITDLYASHPETAYGIMFAVCAFAYIIAWVIMKLLVPQYKIINDL
ncbi:MFS transporter [uncultured Bacteroides sp.]|uniref:MFS transporter n=1 Tax=uncultured Bacteroides sp. TaxID=162156 RepID=UPI002AAB0D3B|nr:MFS transporter [uncultured Bacteroides sp.]